MRGRCPLDDEVQVLSVAVGGTLGGLVSAGTGEKSDNGGGGGGGNWTHEAALAIDEGEPWVSPSRGGDGTDRRRGRNGGRRYWHGSFRTMPHALGHG